MIDINEHKDSETPAHNVLPIVQLKDGTEVSPEVVFVRKDVDECSMLFSVQSDEFDIGEGCIRTIPHSKVSEIVHQFDKIQTVKQFREQYNEQDKEETTFTDFIIDLVGGRGFSDEDYVIFGYYPERNYI